MSSADPRELERLQRLLLACRRGLNHDLTNQLVALRGLLELLAQDEAERLSATGQDYIRRLLGVGERTLALAHTLRDLSRLAGAAPPAEVVALPDIVEEIVGLVEPPPACRCAWEAPQTFGPRLLLHKALVLALSLLAELNGAPLTELEFRSQALGTGIELAVGVGSLADTSRPAPSVRPAVSLSGPWQERLECVLLRELAGTWGGEVQWQNGSDGARVILTLPAPR